MLLNAILLLYYIYTIIYIYFDVCELHNSYVILLMTQ